MNADKTTRDQDLYGGVTMWGELTVEALAAIAAEEAAARAAKEAAIHEAYLEVLRAAAASVPIEQIDQPKPNTGTSEVETESPDPKPNLRPWWTQY